MWFPKNFAKFKKKILQNISGQLVLYNLRKRNDNSYQFPVPKIWQGDWFLYESNTGI